MNDMCIIFTVYRASAETRWLYVSIWPLARMWQKFIFNRTNCSECSHRVRTKAKQRSVSEMHLTILMARDLLTNNLILLPTIEAKGETDDEDRETPKYEKFTCSRWGEKRSKPEKGGWRRRTMLGEHWMAKVSKMCIFSLWERISLFLVCLQHMRSSCGESESVFCNAFRLFSTIFMFTMCSLRILLKSWKVRIFSFN